MDEVKLGHYQHFKGMKVEVLGVAHHTETLDELVVYREFVDDSRFGKNPLWVRPKTMFTETVERNGKKMQRFEYLGK